MLNEEIIKYDTFGELNKYLQAQVVLLRQLVKQFTAMHKQTVIIASVRAFNEYYDGIRVQLNKLRNKILSHLQEQSKEFKLRVERSVIKIEWKETR